IYMGTERASNGERLEQAGPSVSVRGEMRTRLVFLMMLLASISTDLPQLRGQMTDEEKRKLFLKAREDIQPVPRPSASATPRPKPKAAPTPTPTPRPTPKPAPESEEAEPAPRPKPAPSPRQSPTPDVIPLKSPEPAPSQTPPQIPTGKTPGGERLNAPILIEKSGLEEDQGLEPASKSSGGWLKRWRYLSPSVRRAIDQAKVKKGRWKYIIVHNSGTRQGNARIFDTYHRRVRKMQNGLAYHFVIGNGNSSGNGQIEIGSRWTRQINGGHVASDYLNNIALGICLVGDLNRDLPTKAQMAALDELITYLRGRVGKVKGKQAIVLPHKKINPKPTDCPGDRFPYGWLRLRFGS
ncbi:MAG: N-acetylmuramoyl-L-alanine amidase, partial [Terrimicrobiaceae bacterium]